MIQSICLIAVPDDGLRFDPTSISLSTIREDQEYQGVHVRLPCFLGTARIIVQVNVGIGDAITPSIVEKPMQTLLDFPPPLLLVYPIETVVAEKLHAIVRYGLVNSRLKDYFDLWTIAQLTGQPTDALSDAIRATFARRSTPVPVEMPVGLTGGFSANAENQRAWIAYLNRSGLAGKPPARLEGVVESIVEYIDQALSAAAVPKDVNADSAARP